MNKRLDFNSNTEAGETPHLGDEVRLRFGLFALRSGHGEHPHLKALLHGVDGGQLPVQLDAETPFYS